MITVNDLLNLMVLEDDMFITRRDYMYHNGLVENVPDKVKSMEAHAIVPYCRDAVYLAGCARRAPNKDSCNLACVEVSE